MQFAVVDSNSNRRRTRRTVNVKISAVPDM